MAEWIGRLLAEWGYAGVAFLMLLETVFPPLPSEVIMPLAGLNAAKGELGLPGVVLAGTAGAMAGNWGWYLLARWAGEERFRRFARRHGRWLTLNEKDVVRADRWFDRWGAWCVGIGRVVPTARSLVSIPAGLFGMSPLRFLLVSAAGTLAWTGALAWAGHALGERHGAIERWIEPVATGVLVLLLAVYLARLLWQSKG